EAVPLTDRIKAPVTCSSERTVSRNIAAPSPIPINEKPSAPTTLLYCFFASSLCAFGLERQYALRLTVPFSSFLSATQRQSMPAVHASSFFRELHVAHFSGGAGFLSCAFDSFANAMTIATLPSVQTWLRTIWFMALLLASAVAPSPSVSADALAASNIRAVPFRNPSPAALGPRHKHTDPTCRFSGAPTVQALSTGR